MDWIERLNEGVSYIEDNLTDELVLDKMAKIACCSPFHFQRMFSYMAGIPLSEYIRRRRMTEAASDLLSTDERVIDIALKYGYSSPTAFNRAFQGIHGVSPSAARAGKTKLISYPRITFSISIKGDIAMNYRVENKDEFRIVGVSTKLTKEMEINFENVPKLWGKVHAEGLIPKLMDMTDGVLKGVMGVSACNGDDCRYYVAVTSCAPLSEGLEEFTVPAAQWAIFSGRGAMPTAIQELEKRIITEWLPSSGYEYGNAPDIELYMNEDPQNSIFEVWIPIVKK